MTSPLTICRLLTKSSIVQFQAIGGFLLLVGCAESGPTHGAGAISLNVIRASAQTRVDSWTARVSGPSGERSSTGAPGSTIRFSALQPGTYTVVIEGREGGVVTYSGQTSVAVLSGQDSEATISPSGRVLQITIDPTEATLDAVGATVQLTATVRDNGALVSGATPRWRAVGTAASVGASGVVTALAVGTATIHAELGTNGAQASVTVDPKIVTVEATDPNASEAAFDNGVFTITRTGATTSPLVVDFALTGTAVNGTDYQTLSTSAVIAAHQASTTVVVTPIPDESPEGSETVVLTILPGAYAIGASGSATVTLADPLIPTIASVDLGTDSVRLETGESIQLTATARDQNGGIVPATVTWSVVSEAGLIAVSSGGLVTALATPGVAQLRAEAGPQAKEIPVRVLEPYVSLAAGQNHVCGRMSSGAVECWGANSLGQFGNGNTTTSRVPVRAATGLTFDEIFAGGDFTCGIRNGGEVWCWGRNTKGQVGLVGSPTPVLSPNRVSAIITGPMQTLSLGEEHACGIDLDFRVACWGANDFGQLGDNSTSNRTIMRYVEVDRTFGFVAAGSEHTCARRTTMGQIFCWGSNASGQLSQGGSPVPGERLLVPTAIAGQTIGLDNPVANNRHTCVTLFLEEVYCWGDNSFGQLGPNGAILTTPTFVTGGFYRAVATGHSHTCLLRLPGNQVYCIGKNDIGQLGRGEGTAGAPDPLPQPVAGLGEGLLFGAPSLLAAGRDFTCVVTPLGNYCWGAAVGIGDGKNDNRSTPTRVKRSFP